MRLFKILFLTAVVLLTPTFDVEAGDDPTFLIDQQLGQATDDTCQSYVLAIALAFKRDPQLPLKSWRNIRDLETKLRQEVVKAMDASQPNVAVKDRSASTADSAKAVEAVTCGRYTVTGRQYNLTDFGQFVGDRTGITTDIALKPSFIIGGLVKDVVISSAKQIGAKPYKSGHQFAIFGVSGPPNSDRTYLVLNSAAYKKRGAQPFNTCQNDLPDDPGPYFPSLSWRNDIKWNPSPAQIKGLMIERK